MFERLRQSHFGDGGAAREWGQQRVQGSQNRASTRADAERVNDLKWQWRCACEGSSLAHYVYSPSGVSRSTPQVVQVELGPPVALTVRIRPGESAGDFVAAAPSLAAALNLAAVDVVPLRTSWLLRIVLLEKSLAAMPGGG